MNLDFEKFNEEISFSYWEHIPGFNRSIVADSAIPNKWHVMTKDLDKKSASLFTTYENGEIICYDQDIHAVVPQLLDLEPLIETYEKIRRLPNFDSNHCPLMEFQTDRDGKNYFLQYHRTLDFEPADFVLDRLANKDEIEAIFVRGATPKEGIKSKILISKKTHTLFEYERAALDVFTCMEESVATEILSRRIGTLISGPHKNLNILSSFAAEHNNRSLAFKPQNLIIYGEDIFEHAELSYKIMMAHKTGKTQYLDINIVADGRRAILSRS
jgi:hypothetical protein